ncbi:MAG: virulence factor SrfB [Tannerella sp.]|jgi:hypothetical protein|nr:virulence factor SrfB [Tannerella sp.]
MMELIANTGIQFHTTPLEISLNNNFRMYFHEWYDVEDNQLKLEIAHYFPNEQVWVKKYDLATLGYVNNDNGIVAESWEAISKDFFKEGYNVIPIETEHPQNSGCFQESINSIKWNRFENKWIPLPFFLLNGFGPTNWCRFQLLPVEANRQVRKYNLLVAFDTRSAIENEDFENEDLNEAPVFINAYEGAKEYALCNKEFSLVDYCSQAFRCGWVDRYILKLFHGKKVNNIDDLHGIPPKLNYLAQYIFIVRYIQQLHILPTITLYSNRNVPYGKVDLVVDIGSSRTCAVLFDDSDFTKTSSLEDYSSVIEKAGNAIYICFFTLETAGKKGRQTPNAPPFNDRGSQMEQKYDRYKWNWIW